MKLKTLLCGLLASIIGFSGQLYAKNGYYPPERLNCKLTEFDKIHCDEFNRSFLVEDSTNAELSRDRDDVFYFVSAVAYISPNGNESSVFYSYHNRFFKMVRLKTTNNTIRPDLNSGLWHKFNDDIYTCDAGYMNCPITNLPQF